MPMRNVDLTSQSDQFIEAGIASGRFGSASEAVTEALYLLERSESEPSAQWDELQAIAEEAFLAFDRGQGIELASRDEVHTLVQGALDEVRSRRA